MATEQAAQHQFVSNVTNLVQTALNSNSSGPHQSSDGTEVFFTTTGGSVPINLNANDYYPANTITIPNQSIGVGITNAPNPFGAMTWPPMGQLTEADVRRIVQEVLQTTIKEKQEDQKNPNDLEMLMKQFGFPQLMIDIVMKALAEKWPVKKEPKERMGDLIHEEETTHG